MMGRSNGPLRAQHQALYRQRRKLQLKPIPRPWDYLTSAEVKSLAWQAYRVASWLMVEDVAADGPVRTHREQRETFASTLAEMFTDALMAHAVDEGDCWPVTVETPPYRNYPRVWEMLSEDVPHSWRPEYRLYVDVLARGTGVPPVKRSATDPACASGKTHVGVLDAAAAVAIK
jgi:hypothetical protein